MSKLKVNELLSLNAVLSKCENHKDLKSFHTTISIVRLSKSIEKVIKNHFSIQDELLVKLGAEKKQVDGKEVFDWNDKPEELKEKINSSVAELAKVEYEVEYLNKIDEEDFVILTRGLKHSELSFLYEYLVKKED
jgi:hypothetical protein